MQESQIAKARLLEQLDRSRRRISELKAVAVRHAHWQKGLSFSEERYKTLYENIPLMYFTLDSRGIVLSVNSRGAEELGYESAELVGQPVLKVFHEEDRPAVEAQLANALRHPGKAANWEFRKVRKDGSVLWVHETVRSIRASGGETIVLVACADVTERKRAEEQLLEHEELLRSLTSELALAEERERRRISTELHDHIGHNLAMAKMKLAQLKDAEVEEPVRQRLEEVLRLLKETIEATRSLTFELSSPVLYELGLEAAIHDLCQRLEKQTEGGVRFHFESDPEPKPLSDDRSVLLFRAVRELALNVIKHAQASNTRVAMARLRDQVRITIDDDGVGFEASEVADPVASRGRFGLVSIRERLERTGGRLEIESTPGAGTHAVVYAPLDPQRPHDAAER